MGNYISPPWQLVASSTIGGPLAGFYLLSRNFKQVGNHTAARDSVILGLIFTFGVMLASPAFSTDFDPIFFGAVYCGLIYVHAKKCQQIHFSDIGADVVFNAPHWRWIVTGVVCLIIQLFFATLVALVKTDGL